MNKLLSVSILSIVLFGSVDAKIKSYKNIPSCSPSNTAIVFDFQGVIAKIKPLSATKAVFKHPNLFKFIGNVCKWKSGYSVEKAFVENGQKLSTEDAEILNPYEIDKEVVDIAKDLKRRGFSIFLCTDIGKEMLDLVASKHPDIIGSNGIFCSCWVSSKDNGYVYKKDPKAFKYCKDMIQKWANENKKQFTKFIIIDDTKGKLDAASKVGFDGFKFSKAKELKCALVQAIHF